MAYVHRALLFVAALAVSVSSVLAQLAGGPAGHWEGTIQIPEHETKVTVDVARSAAGEWIGSMSIPGSTAIDVPLVSLIVDRNTVRFAASVPFKASFEATLSPDGASLSGKASNPDGSAPLQLTRTGEPNVSVPPPSSLLSKPFEGTWEGSLIAGGQTVRIVLKLGAAADGTAQATLIDSASHEIPATTVTTRDNELHLEARGVSGVYRGTLGAGEIAGEWIQGGARVALTFRRATPGGR